MKIYYKDKKVSVDIKEHMVWNTWFDYILQIV